jgi:aminopeptidase N
MTHSHNGNLAEHATCCGHLHWWRHLSSHGTVNSANLGASSTAIAAARKPFALPGTPRRYAPDMTAVVHHTKLVIHVDPVGKTLAGNCITTIEPLYEGQPIDSLFFEVADIKVNSVRIVGSPADSTLAFDVLDNGILVHFGRTVSKGEKVLVDIDYHTLSPKLGIYFTGPTSLYPQKPYQVWTQSQDDDAHHWFPVAEADHPNHRMTSEVIATVPSGFTALSNGRLVSETAVAAVDEAAGSTTFHWLHDKPHVTYLMALVVGEFVKLEEQYEGMPVEAYVHPSLLERAREYFKGTAELVKLYSDLYGVKYPWPGKYAQVFVQDFIFGGMENTTITVMTDRILADVGTREEQRLQEVRLNAHELNHHWNGDLVTCRDWSHAWLNEGGATFGEVEAVEHLWGEKARDYYALGLAKVYFGEDRRYRRPLVCNTFREPIDLFDRHLYQKGGLVRHMLRHLLGREAYYASIKTYYEDNRFQPVETIDLIKAIEKTTGRNMRKFFDQWVFGAGFPEFKVAYSFDDRQKLATVKVSQVQKLEENTGLFSLPIALSFGFADGTSKEMSIEVSEAEHSFSFSLEKKPTIFRFDPHNFILKKVELNVPKGMLLNQLKDDSTVMGRIYAAEALAKLGGDDVVQALADAARDDFFYGVGIEAATLLGGMKTPAAREALKGLVKVEHAKVRRSVVTALGNFKDASVAKVLVGLISSGKESSQFVIADACVSLGKTGDKSALRALTKASAMDSWNEIIRIGALNGIAELGDVKGVAVATDLASPGKPFAARPAALGTLGRLAKTSTKARQALHKLADMEDSGQFTLRMSLVQAIAQAGNKDSLPVLSQLEQSSFDGRIKRVISETTSSITESKASKPADSDTDKNGINGDTSQSSKLTKLEGQVQELSDEIARMRKRRTRSTRSKTATSTRSSQRKA